MFLLPFGAWPIFKEFAEMDAKVVMPTTVESTFMADELVDDPGMPWHYKTRTPAREVYDAMKPVHDNLQSMGAHVIPTCIPYMHMSVARFAECHAPHDPHCGHHPGSSNGGRCIRR